MPGAWGCRGPGMSGARCGEPKGAVQRGRPGTPGCPRGARLSSALGASGRWYADQASGSRGCRVAGMPDAEGRRMPRNVRCPVCGAQGCRPFNEGAQACQGCPRRAEVPQGRRVVECPRSVGVLVSGGRPIAVRRRPNPERTAQPKDSPGPGFATIAGGRLTRPAVWKGGPLGRRSDCVDARVRGRLPRPTAMCSTPIERPRSSPHARQPEVVDARTAEDTNRMPTTRRHLTTRRVASRSALAVITNRWTHPASAGRRRRMRPSWWRFRLPKVTPAETSLIAK
jgi:hypothetical protein